jgi:hypothetical protein
MGVMIYYFFKNRFLQKKPFHRTFQQQIYLLYTTDKKIWERPQISAEKNSEVKLSLESEKLIQNFNEKQWVFIKKSDHTQQSQGPFSSREIFEFLQNAQAENQDLIWKKGMIAWEAIEDNETFRGIFQAEDNIHFSDTADILESIVEMRRPEMRRVDSQNASPDDDNAVLECDD